MTCGTGFWNAEDATGRDPARTHPTECALVSRGYFAAMGIPLAEVIGVVGDVRHKGPTVDPAPAVFLLHAQTPGYITNLVVRTSGQPLALAAGIRRAVHDADPTQAVSGVRTLEEDVSKVLAPSRLRAVLVTTVAAIAVALAAIGLYGLLAYVVNQRMHEIGVRLALGATREGIFWAFFNQGARLVMVGLALGLAVGLWLSRLVSTFVFGITAGDPTTYVTASAVFVVVAVAAVAVPALRAARVEPIMALRDE